MPTLSKNQVDIIISDVTNESITFSHLADDLIDHICCEVEDLMGSGKDFNDAYKMVKQHFENRTLQKIQESTIYLIDKNYRRMKTTMKITGNVSLAMLGIGTVMKLLHLPGSNLLLMLGFVILCLIFFPSAIYTNYKEQKIKGYKLLHLSILLGGFLFMAGVLFKVLHLNGASILLMSGWIFILFIFLPILLFTKLKEATTKNEKRILILGIIGLIIFELSTMFKIFHLSGATILMIVGSVILATFFLPLYSYSKFREEGKITGQFIFVMISTMFFFLFSILLALNVSTDISKIYINEESNSAKIISYIEKKSQILNDEFRVKSDSAGTKLQTIKSSIQKAASNVCNQIDSIKLMLIMTTENVGEIKAQELANNINAINEKYNTDAVNRLLIENGIASKLKQNLSQFERVTTSNISKNKELGYGITKLISTSSISMGSEMVPWEQLTFNDKPLIGTLIILTDIEKRVRMVEYQTIKQLTVQNN